MSNVENFKALSEVTRGLVAPAHFSRIIEWNNLRNGLDFDPQLEKALLMEEQMEYWTAPTAVDRIDAYCDTLFVLVGTLGKMSRPRVSVDSKGFVTFYKSVATPEHDLEYAITPEDLDLMARDLFGILYNEGMEYELVPQLLTECMEIVIEANEKKPIDELEDNGKVKKGKKWSPPEPAIKKKLKAAIKDSEELRKQRREAQEGNLPTMASTNNGIMVG